MPAVSTAKFKRPRPDVKMLDTFSGEMFVPSPELDEFVRSSFLYEASILYNQDHVHLLDADIGFLWTNVRCTRQMKDVAGMAEIPKPPTASNAWAKARYYAQLRDWFGTDKLDFLITLDAGCAASCSDTQFCALLEHELYHCAQRVDEWGSPKFNQETGRPVFGIKGHDAEEFVGIVARYGASAGAGETAALIAAGKKKPLIAEADIKTICGTC